MGQAQHTSLFILVHGLFGFTHSDFPFLSSVSFFCEWIQIVKFWRIPSADFNLKQQIKNKYTIMKSSYNSQHQFNTTWRQMIQRLKKHQFNTICHTQINTTISWTITSLILATLSKYNTTSGGIPPPPGHTQNSRRTWPCPRLHPIFQQQRAPAKDSSALLLWAPCNNNSSSALLCSRQQQ